MIFLINLPLGAFALAVGARVLPAVPASAPSTRLDSGGSLLAGTAMTLLIHPLVRGRELGWPVWSLVMAAASVPLFAAFGLHQLRRKRRGAATLVEPSVFRKRSYTSGTVFVVVFFGAVCGLRGVGAAARVGAAVDAAQLVTLITAALVGVAFGLAPGP
ncbi:hypothetical protein [Nonomuraea lactucae]|uniref:hypothetical protein n=1 Tax=Nonomuraea lactucae TaxID=2249762 RepID=UPI000DE47B9E|nr:hypothetical protein [Nonomuraea lactucae]